MKKFSLLVLMAILVGGLTFQLLGAWQDSQTIDEGGHLAAGLSYWQQGNFEYNDAHPPLTKLLSAIPLLTIPDLRIDATAQPAIAFARLLYNPTTTVREAQWILFVGRLPLLLFWVALAWAIFLWSKSRWGFPAGLLATSLFVFDPNFLGHGHLINTDVPVMAGFFITIWLADKFLRQPTRKTLFWLVLVFALTQMTKFSAVILWAIIPLLGFLAIFYLRQFTWKWWWAMMVGLAAGMVVMLGVMYGGHVGTIHYRALTLPVLGPEYFHGLASVMIHNSAGHYSYLLGQTSTHGWWYYFPVAMAVKTPILTLVLLFMALFIGGRRWIRQNISQLTIKNVLPFDALIIVVPVLVYLTWSLLSNLNIGLRHIFPIYPFLFMLAGSTVTVFRSKQHRLAVALAGTMTMLVVTFQAWPNTIGYFNALAGGTKNGHKILLDSNLDWGQDVWRLRTFLGQQKFPVIRTAIFGSIPQSWAFPEANHIFLDSEIAAGQKPQDVIIVSKNILYKDKSPVEWLKQYQPTWEIGSSILVYDFR